MTNRAVILSVYIVTFLIGLPTNILSLCAFSIKVHSKPMSTDILLLNLTVSDLLFLIVLPLKMHEAASEMKWLFPYFLCPITSFFFFSTIYTSSLLLMAVSVDRYLGVAFPVHYRLMQKPLYGGIASVIIWVVSSGHCSIVFITEHLLSRSTTLNTEICYDNFSGEQLNILLPVRLESFFVIFLAPLLICTFCYLSCIRILYSQPRICQKKKKAIGMALGTLLVFVICFLPYNVSHVIGFLEGKSPDWRSYTLLLSTFNTCLDPIIFYFSSSTFQNMVKYLPFKVLGLRKSILRSERQSKATPETGNGYDP
ncbi:free fatty acid receptor 3-like [Scleropages formosus]|uniref:free fatty acid receptor 3-like n=1 Tax=Scleropages formosus TaxID=113540 RepID=UPI0010FA6A87|nr:free fatty acid receptor 3-like [Scleropages formosus]